MTRKICYISGTRADFGLMKSTLLAIHRSQELELSIIVTGMHLEEKYGKTVCDIEAAGLPISACVKVNLEETTGATMARNIGQMLMGFVDILSKLKPDLVLLLGDRGEMLAGALAAIHLNFPIAHIHGGERSGSIDEPIRHAISKLSHFHFVATEEAQERLIRMGELAFNVYVTGAPGLDGIELMASLGRETLLNEIGLDVQKPVALMIYHPALQEEQSAGSDAALILDMLCEQDIQVVALKPNSDSSSHQIRYLLETRANDPRIRVITHFPRKLFISWMAAADVLVGNSSAGIIEAASFGTPVINIGSRQNLRKRNANVIDVPVNALAIKTALIQALQHGRYERRNVYGNNQTSSRIVDLLNSVKLDADLLAKTNAY